MKTKHLYILPIIYLVLLAPQAFSQTPTTAYVTSEIVNLRDGPGVTFETVSKLAKGAKVEIVGMVKTDEKNRIWYPVEVTDIDGVFLTNGWIIGQYLKINKTDGWNPTVNYTGTVPDCSNISTQYDNSMNNKLQINVFGGSDCIVKLYNSYDNCIRIAYVKSGDNYAMENIPEGIFHIKIAYGNDYRKKIHTGNCYVKFMHNAQYKLGENVLDFRKKYSKKYEYGKEYNVTSFPSYTLSLSVVNSQGNQFNSDEISETEFNK